MQTVIGAFEDKAQAQRAVDRLVQDGFDRSDVHMEHQDTAADTGVPGPMDTHHPRHHRGLMGFLEELFGQFETYGDDVLLYDEAVRRGSCVVVVDAPDEARARRAAACLGEVGAYDIDERAQQWRSDGWNPQAAAPGAAVAADAAARAGEAHRGGLDQVAEGVPGNTRIAESSGVRVVPRESDRPLREVLREREDRAVAAPGTQAERENVERRDPGDKR